jgi:hypothetical protein
MTKLLTEPRRPRFFDSELDNPSPMAAKQIYATTQQMASDYFEAANISRHVVTIVRHIMPTTPKFDEFVDVVDLADHEVASIKVVLEAELFRSLNESLRLALRQGNAKEFVERVTRFLAKEKVEAESPVVSFLEQAKRLAQRGQIDSALDIIYDQVDELLLAGEFHQVDDLLASATPEQLSIDLLLALLTSTLPAKSKLSNRSAFFRRVEDALQSRGELRDGLLIGLD